VKLKDLAVRLFCPFCKSAELDLVEIEDGYEYLNQWYLGRSETMWKDGSMIFACPDQHRFGYQIELTGSLRKAMGEPSLPVSVKEVKIPI